MKNRKISILVLLIALILTSFFGFVGCSNDGGDGDSLKVNVTFDLSYSPLSGARTKTVQLDADETGATLSSIGVSSTRVGYEFLGYYDSQTGGVQIFSKEGVQNFEISADITLYAQWNIKTYQKTFESQSDKADVSTIEPLAVKIGNSITTLPSPEMEEGYDFVGWASGDISADGVLISNGATVKGEYRTVSENNASVWLKNSALTAVVEISKFTVELIDYQNSQNNEVKIYEYGTAIRDLAVLPNDDARKIEFVGWSTDLYNYKPYTTDVDCQSVKKDLTLYAFYYEYRILEFYKDKSDDFVPVKIYNTTDIAFEMPDIPNPGRELIGWYTSRLFNTSPVQKISFASGITKLYGNWKILDYTATFDLVGGSVVEGGDLLGVNSGDTAIDSINYTVESEMSLPILQKDRFTFKGWYRSDDDTKTATFDIEPGSYGDVTLVAKFEGDKRKVIYHANEGSLGVDYKMVEYYADYTLDIPMSDAYGFFGWYLDENLQTQLTDTEGKGVASPKWTLYDEETHVYAKFLEKRYIILSYSHVDAGTVELKSHYVEGEVARIAVEPKEQYSVESIMINGVKVASGNSYEFTMPADDVMVHVVFKPKTYTITLEIGQGEYCSKNLVVVEYGELFTLPVAFKEGYRFIGWEYSDGVKADILTNSDGTSKDGYLYTQNVTVRPFYVKDAENKDVIIKSASDFLNIKNDPSATYQLVANINMQGRNWTPFDFSGKLFGNGYTITNFNINTYSGNVAMFNNLTGTVDGLTLYNVSIISGDYNGVGASVICYNLNGGTISNCVIESGKVEGEVGYAGGFASIVTKGTISNCVNKANVETDTAHTSDAYAIGGIAGYVHAGTITNCANYGTIKGTKFVGGIIGRSVGGNSGITMNYLENHGNVTGTETFVGGIIGRFSKYYEYSITDLTNTGKIESEGNYVGGLIGYWENIYTITDNASRKVVANSFENSGTVKAEGNYVGGLIGGFEFNAPYNKPYSTAYDGSIALIMKQSKNTGDVSGGLYVGGLIGLGKTDATISVIENGINNSKVTAISRVGGIAGKLTHMNLSSPSNLGSTITATETSIESGNKYAFLGGYVGEAVESNIESATNSSEINYSATSCEGNFVGGIAGWSSGTFTDCKNTATINAPKSNYVGGIAGKIDKAYAYTIKNVSNTGNVTGASYVAGIFGEWYNEFTESATNSRVVNAVGFVNNGQILGTGNYVGGLLGSVYFDAPYNKPYSIAYDGTIGLVMREPKNEGDVEGNYYVGGLIGKITTDSGTSMIEEGVNSSNVKATARVGGIAGQTSTIKLVETTNKNSTVTATGTYDSGDSKYAYVGGYIGYAGNTIIQTAVNNVEIHYSATLCVGDYVGGFTGYSSGTFENCVNNATINAPKSSYVGGISGKLEKAYDYTIETVTNTGNITGASYVAGIFGEWYNSFTESATNSRVVNAIELVNSGNILGSGNYVGGLMGNVYFDTPYNKPYSTAYDGTMGLVLKESGNTGNVEGEYFVGGIAGRISTDSSQTNFIETTSVANVKGKAIIGGMLGEASNVKLTATSNQGSTVTATGTYDSGDSKYAYFGGYIGRAYNVTITDSVNTVEVKYDGELCLGDYVGGFCGYSEGIFTNVENNAVVYAPNSNYVGGIAGSIIRAYTYTIENVTNSNNVTGKNYVAGIFGYWENTHTTQDNSVRRVDANNFTNSGNIFADGNFAGGLIGDLKFDAPSNRPYSTTYDGQQMLYMRNAVNSGNVQGANHIGGLIGRASTDSDTSEIFTCTQTGTITGSENYGDLIATVTKVKLPTVE